MFGLDLLRPALLAGLLGISIPIIIHLLGRKPNRTLPIGTMKFLRRAQAKAAARFRLRRFFLLLARIAMIGLLAFLFAGPGCRDESGMDDQPGSWVLILDTSPSMGSVREGRSALDNAKAALTSIAEGAAPGSRFILLTTRESGPRTGGFGADRLAIVQTLRQTSIEHGKHSPEKSLRDAASLLSGMPNGRVVIATDLQKTSIKPGEKIDMGEIPVIVQDAGFPSPANAWISRIDENDEGVTVRVGQSGAISGAITGSVAVTLRHDKGEDRRSVSKPDSEEIRFRLPEGEGIRPVKIAIQPGGDLPLDDESVIVAGEEPKARVLLVNGDSQGFRLRDELFFLRETIGSSAAWEKKISHREIRPGDLDGIDLTAVDAVLLANVSYLPEGASLKLLKRVREGMGLVLTAGSNWELILRPGASAPAGSETILPLLAAPLRDEIVVTGSNPMAKNFEEIDTGSLSGPIEIFRDPSNGDLSGTRIWRYFVTEPLAGSEIKIPIRLTNGAPLLIEKNLDRGRLILFLSTIDRDGGDICLRPGFLPWIERLFLHAAGRIGPELTRRAVAGFSMALPLDAPAIIEEPDGKEASWTPSTAYTPPVPGLYKIKTGMGDTVLFSAVLDPAESDPARFSTEDLDTLLGKGKYTLGSQSGEAGTGLLPGRRDLSQRIAIALLIAAAIEAALSIPRRIRSAPISVSELPEKRERR